MGFEDGVVRVLRLIKSSDKTPWKSLALSAYVSKTLGSAENELDAELQLIQAFKPHTKNVVSLAFNDKGDILASGVRKNFSNDQPIWMHFLITHVFFLHAPYACLVANMHDFMCADPGLSDAMVIVIHSNHLWIHVQQPHTRSDQAAECIWAASREKGPNAFSVSKLSFLAKTKKLISRIVRYTGRQTVCKSLSWNLSYGCFRAWRI